MSQCIRPRRKAFQLTQLVVALAVVGLAGGISFPVLMRFREDGNRLICANKLRELALATHKFHDTNGTLPPYWGAYPRQDSVSIKGSWFCHLLPYVGETSFYGDIMADIQESGTNWDVLAPSSDEPATLTPLHPEGSEDKTHLILQEVARYNGHSHWEWRAREASPLFETGSSSQAAHDSSLLADAKLPAESGTGSGGIFRRRFSGKTFPELQCPSDPSRGTYPDAGPGRVYIAREQAWGSTNYLANWHAFANNNPHSGYLTPPQNFAAITDGLANTVMYAEGYSWCDGKGRLALNSWDYHSFGLTWSLSHAYVDDGSGGKSLDFPRGMPNTYLFQVQPLAKETPDCPAGSDCCNNWRSQTGHHAMNTAMADGSVREFGRGTSQKVWEHVLLPRDGPIPIWEW